MHSGTVSSRHFSCLPCSLDRRREKRFMATRTRREFGERMSVSREGETFPFANTEFLSMFYVIYLAVYFECIA